MTRLPLSTARFDLTLPRPEAENRVAPLDGEGEANGFDE